MNCVSSYLDCKDLKSDKIAIVFFKKISLINDPKYTTTFLEFYKKTLQAQKYLEIKKIKKGETILFFEKPSANLYALIVASIANGSQVMFLEPWMKLEKINHIIQKVKPVAFVRGFIGQTWGLRSKNLRNIDIQFESKNFENIEVNLDRELKICPMQEDDLAILTFTTGTSGKPKGVYRKHGFLIHQMRVLSKYLKYDLYPKLDLTVFSNVVLLNLTCGKGSLIVPSKWKISFFRALDKLPSRFDFDTLACGPKFLELLMKNSRAKSLKSFHLGGALADCDLYETAMKKWPQAHFEHIYGSTEAEPVSITPMRDVLDKCKGNNIYQALYLGRPVEEIAHMNRLDSLWVSGVHVSDEYIGDDKANELNKYKDKDQKIWHNMGDRVEQKSDGMWYQGRSFQSIAEFELEQAVYTFLQSSKSFIHKLDDGYVLVGENIKNHSKEILDHFGEIKMIKEAKIYRDIRHRSRIDRKKSLKKAFRWQRF